MRLHCFRISSALLRSIWWQPAFALCLNGAEVLNENIFGVYMLAVALISYMTSGYFWGCHCFNRRRYRGKFLLYLSLFRPEFFHYRVPHHLFHNASDVNSDQLCYGKGKNGGIAFRGRQKRAETLTEMSKAILSASDVDTIIDISAKYFSETNQCSVILYVDQPLKPLKQSICTLRDEDERILYSFLEKQVAQRAYDTQNPSARKSKTVRRTVREPTSLSSQKIKFMAWLVFF